MWPLLRNGEEHRFVLSLFRYYKKVMNEEGAMPSGRRPHDVLAG